MPQDFKFFVKIIGHFVFVLLVPSEILSCYPNINGYPPLDLHKKSKDYS